MKSKEYYDIHKNEICQRRQEYYKNNKAQIIEDQKNIKKKIKI